MSGDARSITPAGPLRPAQQALLRLRVLALHVLAGVAVDLVLADLEVAQGRGLLGGVDDPDRGMAGRRRRTGRDLDAELLVLAVAALDGAEADGDDRQHDQGDALRTHLSSPC